MSISYGGIGHFSVTFPNSSGTAGKPCRLDSYGKVVSCLSGDKFIGIVERVQEDYCGVQIGGFVELPYSGTKPSAGYVKLVANGSGGVKLDDTNGIGYWVVKVNSTTSKLTVII